MTTEDKKRVFNSGDFRSLSDSQRRIFRQVVDDLDARLASKELDKNGIMLSEEDKYHGVKTKQNPAVDILQKAQTAMEKTAALLGLTPTGRKRIKDEERIKTASEAWDEQND